MCVKVDVVIEMNEQLENCLAPDYIGQQKQCERNLAVLFQSDVCAAFICIFVCTPTKEVAYCWLY